MQPFELPEFYMPWPARLNPHLEAARTHSKAWAYDVGILSKAQKTEKSLIWDEKTFDAHDYALLCAYIHPDAPEEELNLITDWYVWIFFFDDHFLKNFKLTHDMGGARAYTDRLIQFMPIYPTENQLEPINPVERGLVSLWCSTAFTKSVDWRQRFFQSTKNQYDSSLCELTNINQNRVANPIEYIELRRMVGGAPWSADLTEHAVFVDIPSEIMATRPLQVLKDTFSDAVHLHNDLFSYQREVHEEGEKSNCVLVLETFLNVDTQRAANITNDLLTSRLHQFEHTALTELPLLFEKHAIDPALRLSILSYVKALRDWLSGSHEWHIRSSRYMNEKVNTASVDLMPGIPTGWGTSAAWIGSIYRTMGFRSKNYTHIPYEYVGRTVLPKFYMPFPSLVNPHLAAARKSGKQWAQRIGLLDSLLGFSNVFIWDERKLDIADFALVSALVQPNVSFTQLDLTNCWFLWGTYADDYFPLAYNTSRDMVGARLFIARLSEFLTIDSPSPKPTNPMEFGLYDLWIRTTENLSRNEKLLFRQAFEEFTASWLWELTNHIQNRVPDPIDYVEMRRKTFAWDMTKIFTRISLTGDILPTIYNTRTMREMSNITVDYIALTNDIFSYQKEIEFEGELNNAVLVAQCFMGCTKNQAVEIVNNLMTARIQQFELLVTTELPILFEQFNLNVAAQQNLFSYVKSLQYYMSGILQWHLVTNRYKESELQNERLRRSITIPAKLGTSATHIPTLLKTTEKVQVKHTPLTQDHKLGTSAMRILEMLKADSKQNSL